MCGSHSKTENMMVALFYIEIQTAPYAIQGQSIPKVELDSCVGEARLVQLIVHENDLPIEKVHYWSGSTIALQYIKNRRKRLKIFERELFQGLCGVFWQSGVGTLPQHRHDVPITNLHDIFFHLLHSHIVFSRSCSCTQKRSTWLFRLVSSSICN